MIHSVSIYNITASDAVDLKNQLVAEWELVDGQDFTWSWYPTTLDEFSYFTQTPAHVEFKFCDQRNATFFQLKYAQ
jgi:hypothetical protein